MDSLPIALIVTRDVMTSSLTSALPHAPVVTAREAGPRPQRMASTRGLLASALHRTADAIAPRTCSPVA